MAPELLIGREFAIGALRSAVDRSAVGTGGVVLLLGDAGMGKTALATETATYAASRGAVVVWGVCWEAEGAPGLWPWVQVARALDYDKSAGCSFPPAVIGALDGTADVLATDDSSRFRTYDAVATHLRNRAGLRPVVVILDDLQWADVSSLRLLLFVARQLRDAAVLILGTCRDTEVAHDDPAGPLLDDLASESETLQLAGLRTDDVAALLHRVCGVAPTSAFAAAVQERTGGNPLFVQQLGRLLASQDQPGDRSVPAALPPAVADVLTRRLARLPEPVVGALAAAAVLGARFSIAGVAAIQKRPLDETVALIDSGVRAGVLTSDTGGLARFVHDLFREVLYESLPMLRRAEVHLAAAEWLESRPDSAAGAAEIAHHRLAARPLGERGLLVAALVTSAREAAARTAFSEAAEQLQRAIDITGGRGAAQGDLLYEYGEALRRSGAAVEARDAFAAVADHAREAGDVQLLGRAAFGEHRISTITDGSRGDVIAHLDEALAALGDRDDSAQRWLLSASLARELADGPNRDLVRASNLATAAVEGARAESGATLAYALFALIDVGWEPGTASRRATIADELAAVATRAGERELVLEAQLAKLAALLELGDPQFTVELEEFKRSADESGIPRYRYLARSRVATLATLTGPLEHAADLIDDAAGYGNQIGEPDTWGVQASQLAALALLRHDWTRLHDWAAANGKALTPPEFAGSERAWLLVEAGDVEAAAAVLRSIPDHPGRYRWRDAALLTMDAELAVAVGDRARCQTLYERLLPLTDNFAVVAAAVFTTGPVSLQLGLLADVLDQSDLAVTHLEHAVAACDRLGADLLAGRARRELARLTTDRVRTDESSASLAYQQGHGDWTVCFAGRSARLRDSKGLRDLIILLSSPGREVAAADLVAGPVSPATPPLGADPVLDERARAAYRHRLDELDAELAEADRRSDRERSARAAAEHDLLVEELRRATGLGGRPRRLNDVNERARSTVTARIRDCIRRLDDTHPELATHLRASVATGSRCVYRPAETVRWHISQS